MLNETKDFSGKYVRLYMGNGEYQEGKVSMTRKVGDHWQFTFDSVKLAWDGEHYEPTKLDWHWGDTRFVQEVKRTPMPRRIVNFIIRALGYRMLNKLFRKIGL
jgi:hypothetical protein